MRLLISFLEAEDVTKSEIYHHLKCNKVQATLLQKMMKRYISGQDEIVVADLLQELFGEENYLYIHHLGDIKALLELGWVMYQSFQPFKVSDLSYLELLNSGISLTTSFLRLLEEGSSEQNLPVMSAYGDHLEYLQDQFLRIELYQKMSKIRHNIHEHSLGIGRVKSKLEQLEQRIEKRVQKSDQQLPLDKIFKQKKLDEKEQIIFLALLKEEYNAGESSIREMNTLIDLVSFDEYDRIKNRALLEEGATLVASNLIDYEEMLSPFGNISRTFYIVDDVLQSIMHPQKKKKVRKLKLDMLIKEQDIFELIEPDSSLDDVVLHPKTKAVLDNIMRQMDKEVVSRLQDWGIKSRRAGIDARIIFYGPPGTGKTMTSYSLAKSLKRQVLAFDCSKILSMYVGESEKNVRKIFDTYTELTTKSKTEPILLLNEADQFLGARSSGANGGAEQMHNQMQNIFLEQIERFNGVLIATTNLLENIDMAFSRRFNYKIHFSKPDKAQRKVLWEKMLPKEAPFSSDFNLERLLNVELSGGQISLIIKNAAYAVATMQTPLFTTEVFLNEIEKERRGSFDSEKQVGFLQG